MPFKDMSYLDIWQPFCSAECNHLCNFLVQEEMSFKRFLNWSSGSPPLRRSGTIYAVLNEGIMGNIHVKLHEIWTVVQEEMSFKDISFLELWQPPCSVDLIHLCNIGRRHHEERSCVIILNLFQQFRRKRCLNIFLIWSSGSPFVQPSITI